MKKIFSIFIALVYFATSSGLALQVHYCMDKVSGMSLVETEKKACDKCGMKKAANPCCKDELKFIKLQDAHKLMVTAYAFHPPVATVSQLYDQPRYALNDATLVSGLPGHAPPLPPGKELHILHCVFRI